MTNWMWLLAIVSLVGVILNIKKKKICFLIWIFTNAIWAIIDFKVGLTAQGFLFLIYTALAIWGFWEWKFGKGARKSYNCHKDVTPQEDTKC